MSLLVASLYFFFPYASFFFFFFFPHTLDCWITGSPKNVAVLGGSSVVRSKWKLKYETCQFFAYLGEYQLHGEIVLSHQYHTAFYQ